MSALERAAEAMHALGNSDPWERQHEYVRQEFRDDARAAFKSIDVGEMAGVIDRAADDWDLGIGNGGQTWEHALARAVRNYLTGDESDE